MWAEYLRLGDVEIVNSPRAVGYARAYCAPWIEGEDSQGLRTWLGDGPYTDVVGAPWYDANDASSGRFYGVHVIDILGTGDSTREVPSSQAIMGGSVLGRERQASKIVRVRAWLTALGYDAIDTGMSWVEEAISNRGCSVHGSTCGTSSLSWFAAEPAQLSTEMPGTGGGDGFGDGPFGDDAFGGDTDTSSTIVTTSNANNLLRFLHGVKAVSGPLTVSEFQRSGPGGMPVISREIEFSFEASKPEVYAAPVEVIVPATSPRIIQDIPINLTTHPSAELSSGTVLVGTNYATNPSAEGATAWAGSAIAISGASPSAYVTNAPSTDLAAVGAQSSRTQLLGNGSTAASGRANLFVQQQVTIDTPAAGARMSITMWAAAIIAAGSSVSAINGLVVEAQWLTSGGAVIRTDALGTASAAEFGGRIYAARSLAVPSNAAAILVRARADVTWSSSSTASNNSDIRLYADALAPTVP